jgi:hypothetical protein
MGVRSVGIGSGVRSHPRPRGADRAPAARRGIRVVIAIPDPLAGVAAAAPRQASFACRCRVRGRTAGRSAAPDSESDSEQPPIARSRRVGRLSRPGSEMGRGGGAARLRARGSASESGSESGLGSGADSESGSESASGFASESPRPSDRTSDRGHGHALGPPAVHRAGSFTGPGQAGPTGHAAVRASSRPHPGRPGGERGTGDVDGGRGRGRGRGTWTGTWTAAPRGRMPPRGPRAAPARTRAAPFQPSQQGRAPPAPPANCRAPAATAGLDLPSDAGDSDDWSRDDPRGRAGPGRICCPASRGAGPRAARAWRGRPASARRRARARPRGEERAGAWDTPVA